MTAFVLISSALVAIGAWEPVGPSGGQVSLVLQSSQDVDVLYCVTPGFGASFVSRSADGGSTWEVISQIDNMSNPYDITMNGSGTLVVVQDTQVSCSSDGGYTWSNSVIPGTYFRMVVPHPTVSNGVMAAGFKDTGTSMNMSLLISTNGGQTWSDIPVISSPNDTYGACIAVCPSDPDRIIIGGYGMPGTYFPRLMMTDDGGANFTDITPAGAQYYFLSTAFDPTTPSVILAGDALQTYRTTDFGSSWAVVLYNLVLDMEFSTVETGLVLGTSSDYLQRSTNGGQTWSTISQGLSGEWMESVELHSSNASLAYTGSTHGFFRSTDGGQSWNLQISGLDVGTILALDREDDWILASMEGKGVWRAQEDSTMNWQQLNTPSGMSDICAIKCFGQDTILILEGYDSGNAELYRSTNGGSSWSVVDSYYTNGDRMINQHGSTLWMWGEKYDLGTGDYTAAASVSYDAGASWTRHVFYEGPDFAWVKAIAVDPQDPDRVFCMGFLDGSPFLEYTLNGGSSWSDQPMSGFTSSARDMLVSPDDADLLAVASTGGLYRSTDAGASWTRVTYAFSGCRDLMVSDLLDGVTVATDQTGIWLWDWYSNLYQINDDLRPERIYRLCESAEYVYAGSEGGAVWRSYNSTGTQEGEEGPGAPGLTIFPNPSTGYASVSFTVPVLQPVSLALYDISGRRVLNAMDGEVEEYSNSLTLDTSVLSPGIYFVRLETERDSLTRRMVVTR